MNQSTKDRSGISLLEVILAISILVGSAAVLGQLISIGQMQAEKATELTEAQALCNNKMNELLSGIEPIEPVELQPVSLESPWDYSIQLEPGFATHARELTNGLVNFGRELKQAIIVFSIAYLLRGIIVAQQNS